jgi:hypothetical protein
MELTGHPPSAPTPSLECGHKQPVAGDGLRSFAGIILGHRSFDEAQRLARFAPAIEGRPPQPTEPALVSKKPTTHSGRPSARPINRSLAKLALFLAYSGSGEVIHLLARSQRSPIGASDARTVSAVMRSSVKPSSKLISAANSSVHTLVCFRTPWVCGAKARARPHPVRDPGRPYERCADIWSLAKAPAGAPSR